MTSSRWRRLAPAIGLAFQLAACARRNYLLAGAGVEVPEESSWCFVGCERAYNQCLTSCAADMDCECACRTPKDRCMMACPGAVRRGLSPQLREIEHAICPPRDSTP